MRIHVIQHVPFEGQPAEEPVAPVQVDRELLERQELRPLGAAVDPPGDDGEDGGPDVGGREDAAREGGAQDQGPPVERHGDRPRDAQRGATEDPDAERAREGRRSPGEERDGRRDEHLHGGSRAERRGLREDIDRDVCRVGRPRPDRDLERPAADVPQHDGPLERRVRGKRGPEPERGRIGHELDRCRR